MAKRKLKYPKTICIGEVLTISEVRPVYRLWKEDRSELVSLVLAFTEMPKTRFRPGMRIRVTVEK